MHKQIVFALGGGLASAALSIGALAGNGSGILLAYFAPLPILLVGLALGTASAAIAAATAAILIAALAGGVQAIVYAFSVALPPWIIVRYALMKKSQPDGSIQWFPIGDIVSRLAALGALIVVCAAIFTASGDGGFQGRVYEFLDTMLGTHIQIGGTFDRADLIDRLALMFPGVSILSWILMIVINAVLAQVIVVKAAKNLRPEAGYARLSLPEWIYWVFIAVAGVTLLSSGTTEYVARNLSLILAAPFFFVGLGIVHTLARRLTTPGMALTAFYVLIMMVPWAGIVLTVAGFFEPWIRLRDRFSQPPGIQKTEEE
ncbi:MAG: DUF2232 domain-containing protein [Rhodospirillales bacterium]|nr:DUF2232 domain-containing protein [Rhodospirillales bacterium]